MVHFKQTHRDDLHVPIPEAPDVLVVPRNLHVQDALRETLHELRHVVLGPVVLLPRFDQPLRQLQKELAQLARPVQPAGDRDDRAPVRAEVAVDFLEDAIQHGRLEAHRHQAAECGEKRFEKVAIKIELSRNNNNKNKCAFYTYYINLLEKEEHVKVLMYWIKEIKQSIDFM